MGTTEEDEGHVYAKIEEVDAMISKLQKRKQELVEAMDAMKEDRSFGEASRVSEFEKDTGRIVDARVLKALNSVSWKGFGAARRRPTRGRTRQAGAAPSELAASTRKLRPIPPGGGFHDAAVRSVRLQPDLSTVR